jgi:GrpB-like predicted nucleotidyltransferase (UPF0157 family)
MLGVPRGRVLLTEYSERWPEEFTRERRRLDEALGELAVDIIHIGSTAVEGLVAKPIIDITVGLRAYEDWPAMVAPMQALGYQALGEFGLVGRQFFLLGNPTTHHVHACVHNGAFWNQTILFHRVLESRPQVRDAYAQLKRELARRHADNREAYTQGKGEFIMEALREAGWRPDPGA